MVRHIQFLFSWPDADVSLLPDRATHRVLGLPDHHVHLGPCLNLYMYRPVSCTGEASPRLGSGACIRPSRQDRPLKQSLTKPAVTIAYFSCDCEDANPLGKIIQAQMATFLANQTMSAQSVRREGRPETTNAQNPPLGGQSAKV